MSNKFGICVVSICPVRKEASDTSEMVTQLLFGEQFSVIAQQKQWLKIKIDFDGYEGWIDQKQIEIIERKYVSNPIFVSEIIDLLMPLGNYPLAITLGAELPNFNQNKLSIGDKNYSFEGKTISGNQTKQQLVTIGMSYLNAPYLWGGKTPFGIDCSGLTQMVYKLCGHILPRDASPQAELGEVLSFIDEAEPGDLAFFENETGKIIHVGILLENNKILHAHGKVRIDPIDHSGIFNTDSKKHSHKLRMVKRLV